MIIKGGTANVSNALSVVSARNALALGQLDPSVLDMTVDGAVVLHSGVTTGPVGALASARIDAGDQIKITVNGAARNYTFNHSQNGSTTLFGQFFMVGSASSGFYDTNNVPLTGSAFPIKVNVPITKSVDVGHGDSIVQTGLATFNSSLLSYIIFAANEETRASRFRRGLGDEDDLGAPACK